MSSTGSRIGLISIDSDGSDGVDEYRLAINNHATKLESAALYISGLFSARPSAGIAGRTFYATDTGAAYLDIGSAWVAAPIAAGSITAAMLASAIGAWTTYTPTWTAASSNPSLGNGTLLGRYSQIGKTVAFRIFLSIGSTTTQGSGTWRFALPFASPSDGSDQVVNGFFAPSGGVTPMTGTILSGGTLISELVSPAPNVLNESNANMSAGNVLAIAGTYESV